ncbi:hypothetical protein [Streptomyces sp. NBC_00996]|uniref:hypothetical protein n=1 Tax=Streptomyces sp. NBC_00996 TaxID=2903710 RepID=UPI003867CEB9|nr:hypothetical protein OG390_07215 [Streptomyces sp. NBC_00996]
MIPVTRGSGYRETRPSDAGPGLDEAVIDLILSLQEIAYCLVSASRAEISAVASGCVRRAKIARVAVAIPVNSESEMLLMWSLPF